MSLIHDALRRTSAGQNGTTPQPAPPVIQSFQPEAPLPFPDNPENADAEPPKKTALPFILFVLLIVCVAGALVVYFWEKGRRSKQAQASAQAGIAATVVTQQKQDARSVDAKITSGDVAAAAPAAKVQPVSAAVSSTPGPVQQPAIPVATATTRPAVPVQFPPLRLQSIFFKPSNPSVMINGRTLFVNDEIQGVTVAGIEPASVTLVLSGQTNVLTLR